LFYNNWLYLIIIAQFSYDQETKKTLRNNAIKSQLLTNNSSSHDDDKKGIDYGLLSANAIVIPGIFIFFAIASQLPASTVIGFHEHGCSFGFNLSPQHGQIAVVIAGGVLLIPFGLSCVLVILRNKFAGLFALIGFALTALAAAIILISLSCRLPSEFLVIVMVAPFIITIINSTIIYFKKGMNR
jgi:hypothetical protein